MDQLEAEYIVKCLEDGVVPVNSIFYMTAGREKETQNIIETLRAIKNNESKILFVHGDYGVGKTHFLEIAKSNAIKSNFIVSHITLSSRESPLSEMVWVYAAIMKNISFAGCSSPSPLISFLDEWLNYVNKKVMKHRGKRCVP